jgi:hypothetical protein
MVMKGFSWLFGVLMVSLFDCLVGWLVVSLLPRDFVDSYSFKIQSPNSYSHFHVNKAISCSVHSVHLIIPLLRKQMHFAKIHYQHQS